MQDEHSRWSGMTADTLASASGVQGAGMKAKVTSGRWQGGAQLRKGL